VLTPQFDLRRTVSPVTCCDGARIFPPMAMFLLCPSSFLPIDPALSRQSIAVHIWPNPVSEIGRRPREFPDWPGFQRWRFELKG